MDCRFPDRNVGQLLSDDMGRISHRYVLFPFWRSFSVVRSYAMRMTLCRKFSLDDLTSDPSLGRPTLPRRVLGTNRRDSDDCGHLHHHRALWYGYGFLESRRVGCHPNTFCCPQDLRFGIGEFSLLSDWRRLDGSARSFQTSA